jgi:hypothetical protein
MIKENMVFTIEPNISARFGGVRIGYYGCDKTGRGLTGLPKKFMI